MHSLIFVLIPLLHVFVHGVHSVQSVHMGHLFRLHGLSSSSGPGQNNADFSFGRTHFLSLLCVPPSHDCVHSVHSVHSVQTGQLCSLHCSSYSASPRHPPTLLGSTHSLTFFLTPPPQVLVHSVQSDHSVKAGHSSSLQLSDISNLSRQSLLTEFLG